MSSDRATGNNPTHSGQSTLSSNGAALDLLTPICQTSILPVGVASAAPITCARIDFDLKTLCATTQTSFTGKNQGAYPGARQMHPIRSKMVAYRRHFWACGELMQIDLPCLCPVPSRLRPGNLLFQIPPQACLCWNALATRLFSASHA